VGMALDYFEDIKYSFEEVFKLYPPELQLGFLKFLKGTPVRHKAEQHGFIYDPNPPYQIIESNYLSREQLHKIELLEHALEIYWNKPRAFNTLKYITEKYSIFDFLMGLGIHFSEHKDLIKYTLKDVYEMLYTHSIKTHPDDDILKQLISIDYYLYYKVKPETLFWPEILRGDKYALLDSLHLNHNKYRFVVLPISFDFSIFEKDNHIVSKESHFIIQYDGREKPIFQITEVLEIA
jgi:anaerobic magnesium-protoporphyrin IX monomethyl ester cyclase